MDLINEENNITCVQFETMNDKTNKAFQNLSFKRENANRPAFRTSCIKPVTLVSNSPLSFAPAMSRPTSSDIMRFAFKRINDEEVSNILRMQMKQTTVVKASETYRKKKRDVSIGNAKGQTFGERCLTNSRITQKNWIVLCSAT